MPDKSTLIFLSKVCQMFYVLVYPSLCVCIYAFLFLPVYLHVCGEGAGGIHNMAWIKAGREKEAGAHDLPPPHPLLSLSLFLSLSLSFSLSLSLFLSHSLTHTNILVASFSLCVSLSRNV